MSSFKAPRSLKPSRQESNPLDSPIGKLADALASGRLVHAGVIDLPEHYVGTVVLSAAAWADCVAWSEADSRAQVTQYEATRVWNLLYCAACALRCSESPTFEAEFEVPRVPRDGVSVKAKAVRLAYRISSGDRHEPVMMIRLPIED